MDKVNAIGIMSGTSLDAIDAVLVEIDDSGLPSLIATTSEQFPLHLRQDLIRLCHPGDNEIELAGRCHTYLGELYADIANKLVRESGVVNVAVIGCHGQTVRHRPAAEHAFTMQLGNGAVSAQRTGIPVVTDFRSADIARGGQGAPFAPFFHNAMFRDLENTRAIVNLGGIANITVLPSDQTTPITGFDSGPANGLLDRWIFRCQNKRYDENGDWARLGVCNEDLLLQMVGDPYFELDSPKSTGSELFNDDWISKQLDIFGQPVADADVQSTLAHLTALSIALQLNDEVSEIYLCGGGTKNGYLIELLEQASQRSVQTTDAIGFPADWIESAAFAWMANHTILRTPCTLPSVTGAACATITGAIYFP